MADLVQLRAALEKIDWDFPSAGTPQRSVQSLHRFPGNFIPQIPSAMIQILSDDDDLVLDPFCGSGTTALAALKLGRRTIVSDRLRASALISKGKLSAAMGVLDRATRNRILAALAFDELCRSDSLGRNNEGSHASLTRWFAPGTLAQLRFIWSLIQSQTDELQPTLTLAFSDILVQCASTRGAKTSSGGTRRHHWGWIADNVQPKVLLEHNAVAAFRERVAALPELPEIENSSYRSALVVRQDARQLSLPDNSVDFVVTSPPYVGVIDYALAHRLLYLWMGWSMDDDRKHEIGARFKRHRHSLESEYAAEMHECWRELHRVLKSGSFCAVVIGESRRFHGSVDRTLNDLGRYLQKVWGPVSRVPSRRRVATRGATEFVEQVCVFQKT